MQFKTIITDRSNSGFERIAELDFIYNTHPYGNILCVNDIDYKIIGIYDEINTEQKIMHRMISVSKN